MTKFGALAAQKSTVIVLETNVRSVHGVPDSWIVSGICDGQSLLARSRAVVLCTNRRLGCPRVVNLPCESAFHGKISRGLGQDLKTMSFADKTILMIGMGAFAIEHMRASLERRALHATILCRQRGTVSPQVVDWINYIRPFDHNLQHSSEGDASIFMHWQHVYSIAHAKQPACWKQGLLKPDGHGISILDLFFVAHYVGTASTHQGTVGRVVTNGILTTEDIHISAEIL